MTEIDFSKNFKPMGAYKDTITDVNSYDIPKEGILVSEKYDGVRAIWDGDNTFYTKTKHIIHVPDKYKKMVPKGEWLDGELWFGRGTFQSKAGIIRRKEPSEDDYKDSKFKVFDTPNNKPYVERYNFLKKYIKNNDFVELVEHKHFTNLKDIEKIFLNVIKNNGEGLMLRRLDGPYKNRHVGLQRIKKIHDSEAVVVGYAMGTGRNKNVNSSLKCVDIKTDKKFKVGTGLTHSDIENIESKFKIGTIIVYEYRGLSKDNIPIMIAYKGIRPIEDTNYSEKDVKKILIKLNV